MTEIQNTKKYDLEERTEKFALEVRKFVKGLHKNIANMEDAKQLIRASGSVGANYIEANDSLSRKDFIMRVKICRKEAKECRFWLRLVDMEHNSKDVGQRDALVQEVTELMNIFGAIIRKSSNMNSNSKSKTQETE